MDVFLERGHHYMRKYHWRILQSKGHNDVLKTASFDCESCLSPIFRCDLDLMVPSKAIHE